MKRMIKGLILLSWVAYGWIIIMLVTDLSGRFFFDRPLPASIEISDIVMPWLVFPAYAYTLAIGGHIRVSLVTNRMSPRMRLWSNIFASVLGLALFVPLIYMSSIFFWESWVIKEQLMAPIFVPWYVGKFIFPICLGFFCIQYVMHIVESLRKLRQVAMREVIEKVTEVKEFG